MRRAAEAVPEWKQGPGTPSRFPLQDTTIEIFEQSFAVFQANQQGIELEME